MSLSVILKLFIVQNFWINHFTYRIQVAEKTYKDSFDDELNQFKARIQKRAAEKIQIALKEQEEEERKERLGPGGLDPVEVYAELPDVSISSSR